MVSIWFIMLVKNILNTQLKKYCLYASFTRYLLCSLSGKHVYCSLLGSLFPNRLGLFNTVRFIKILSGLVYRKCCKLLLQLLLFPSWYILLCLLYIKANTSSPIHIENIDLDYYIIRCAKMSLTLVESEETERY